MRAGDLMRRDFRTIHPDETLPEIVSHLGPLEGDWAPVCEGAHFVGMIRYDDLAVRVAGNGGLSTTRARDLLADEVCFCFENTRLAEAAALMSDIRLDRLPVVSPSGDLVGILARDDIPTDNLTAEE
jgi:CBS domain-containing protein